MLLQTPTHLPAVTLVDRKVEQMTARAWRG